MKKEDWKKSELKQIEKIQILLVPTQRPMFPETLLGKWDIDYNESKEIYYLVGVFNRTIVNCMLVVSSAKHESGSITFEPSLRSEEDNYVLRAVQDKYGEKIRNYASGFRSRMYGNITKEEYIIASKKGRKNDLGEKTI